MQIPPDRQPTIEDYYHALALSSLGSIVGGLIKDKFKNKKFKGVMIEIIQNVMIGSFAGLMFFYFAKSLNMDLFWTHILTGISGLSGKEMLELLQKEVKRKISSDQSRNNDDN